MNVNEYIFDKRYEDGHYLQFTMDVPFVVPHLIATVESYRIFALTKNLEAVVSCFAEIGMIYEPKALLELFVIHDVLAEYFGHHGYLNINFVWKSYVRDFTGRIVKNGIKEAGWVIFESYCFREFKAKSIEE